jgi:hypothetical protein
MNPKLGFFHGKWIDQFAFMLATWLAVFARTAISRSRLMELLTKLIGLFGYGKLEIGPAKRLTT